MFGAGLLLVLAIVVPPARLHSLDLETSLAEHLGYPVHIESAYWRWDPGPTVELRDAVAEQMTPAQIAEARRLARAWLESHGNEAAK